MCEEMAVLCDSVGVLAGDLCENHWFSSHASCMVPNRSHKRLAVPFSFWDIWILLLKCRMARDPFFLVHRI